MKLAYTYLVLYWASIAIAYYYWSVGNTEMENVFYVVTLIFFVMAACRVLRVK
jgi:hypothetical protein